MMFLLTYHFLNLITGSELYLVFPKMKEMLAFGFPKYKKQLATFHSKLKQL